MARARNIKPGFFSNDDLVELPFEGRLLFIGLWTIADRAGRLLDRPKKIKMDLFPADNVDIDALLNGLAERGFLHRYEAKGIKCIQIINWSKHQNPHIKETDSTIPEPCKHDTGTVQVPEIPDRAVLIPDSLNLIPDSLETTTSSSGDDLFPMEVQAQDDDVRKCPIRELIELYHECLPNNPIVKVMNAARRGAIRQRWREAAVLSHAPFGYKTKKAGLAAWREFFTICSESEFLTGLAPPTNGKRPFVADIDFIMSPSGFARIIENKYHRVGNGK